MRHFCGFVRDNGNDIVMHLFSYDADRAIGHSVAHESVFTFEYKDRLIRHPDPDSLFVEYEAQEFVTEVIKEHNQKGRKFYTLLDEQKLVIESALRAWFEHNSTPF